MAERQRSFHRPALVVWAKEDRVMPPEHGCRLAGLLPRGRLVEIPDSYSLISEDQPKEFARLIRGFVRDAQRCSLPGNKAWAVQAGTTHRCRG